MPFPISASNWSASFALAPSSVIRRDVGSTRVKFFATIAVLFRTPLHVIGRTNINFLLVHHRAHMSVCFGSLP